MENAQHDENEVPNDKSSGQQVYEFESVRIFFLQFHAGLARVLHLLEKRTEFDAPFVIDESLGEQSATVTISEDSGTQVNILSIAHGCEASQSLINAFLDPEIETSGIEFVQLLLAATDAASGEK